MELTTATAIKLIDNQASIINADYALGRFDQAFWRAERLWNVIDCLDDCENLWQRFYERCLFATGRHFDPYRQFVDYRQRDYWMSEKAIESVVDIAIGQLQVMVASGFLERAIVANTQLCAWLDDLKYYDCLRANIYQVLPELFHGHQDAERRLQPRWVCTYNGRTVTVRAASRVEAQFEAAQILVELTEIDASLAQDDNSIVPSYV